VLIKLRPYPQLTLKEQANRKLQPKFYGPFRVIKAIRDSAYMLELLPDARVHPTFHVSQLKQFHGDSSESTFNNIPTCIRNQQKEPKAILECRIIKLNRKSAT
jgi:hypothetical protein